MQAVADPGYFAPAKRVSLTPWA